MLNILSQKKEILEPYVGVKVEYNQYDGWCVLSNKGYNLGGYETEKRALEIIQDIKNSLHLTVVDYNDKTFSAPFIYEMPEK